MLQASVPRRPGSTFAEYCSPYAARHMLLAMKAIVLALLLALAACDAGHPALRQVTIESPVALGLSLRELPSEALRASGLAYGLAVVKAGSIAERAGLRIGDIVYAV